MLVKLRFLMSKRNLLRGSRVSSVHNAGKIPFSDLEAQPSAGIVRVDRPERWYSCVF